MSVARAQGSQPGTGPARPPEVDPPRPAEVEPPRPAATNPARPPAVTPTHRPVTDLRHLDGDLHVEIADALGFGADEAGSGPARLMVAAAHVFAEKGFHATTTRDIAAGAGLSPAAVYVHYPSKEELFFQACERVHRSALTHLTAIVDAAPDPTTALAALVGGFSRWHAEHPAMGRLVQHEYAALDDEHKAVIRRIRRDIDDLVARVVHDGMTAGEFSVDDPWSTVVVLMSMAVDVARWYGDDARRTPEEIEKTYGDLAVRLVRA